MSLSLTERIQKFYQTLDKTINKEMPKIILAIPKMKNGEVNSWIFYDTALGRRETLNEHRPELIGGRVNSRTFSNSLNFAQKKAYIQANSRSDCLYFKYSERYKLLCVALIHFETRRPSSTLEYKWNIIDTVFFEQKSKIPYSSQGAIKTQFLYRPYWRISLHAAPTFDCWISTIKNLPFIRDQFNANITKWLERCYYIREGNKISIFNQSSSLWQLQEYIGYTDPLPRTGRKQQLIDKYNAIPMTPMEQLDFLHWQSLIDSCTYLEQVGDAVCCRYFQRVATPLGDIFHEGYRLFITAKSFVGCRCTNQNQWIPYLNINSGCVVGSIINLNTFKPTVKTKFDYIRNLIQPGHTLKVILNLLQYPFLERLWKRGFGVIPNLIQQNHPLLLLEDKIGDINIKSSDPLKGIGISAYQMEQLNEIQAPDNSNSRDIIKLMKSVLGISNLADLDNHTFDIALRSCLYFNSEWTLSLWQLKCCSSIDPSGFTWRTTRYSGLIVDRRVLRASMPLDNIGILFLRMAKLVYNPQTSALERPSSWSLLLETLSVFENFTPNERPIVNWLSLKTREDVVQLHDRLILRQINQNPQRRCTYRTVAQQEEEALAKQRAQEQSQLLYSKTLKERQFWNYEDDTYSIFVPVKLQDIVKEGESLHHCVGGYVDNHAKGHTTVCFLRKKDNLEKSFYTIEVSPDKVLRQIHGSCNRWFGNNPEAIPTVLRWMRDKGITYNDSAILTSTAEGYGRGNNDCVPMPEID